MKTLKPLYHLFYLLPFVALLGKCDKDDNFVLDTKIHRIILTCDTIPTKDNFNQVCNFGQKEGANKEFTIDAWIGDVVIWEGELSNPKEGKIRIDNIIYESGTNIFKNKNIHDRQDGKEDGQVVAVVKQGKEKDQLKYKLRFTVYNSENKPVITDTIDPKIRMIRISIKDSVEDSLEDPTDDN